MESCEVKGSLPEGGEKLTDVLLSMLSRNYADRPSMKEVLKRLKIKALGAKAKAIQKIKEVAWPKQMITPEKYKKSEKKGFKDKVPAKEWVNPKKEGKEPEKKEG